jgi:hypothetical protein
MMVRLVLVLLLASVLAVVLARTAWDKEVPWDNFG